MPRTQCQAVAVSAHTGSTLGVLGTTVHLQLGAFPAAFLVQSNTAQLFVGPGHLLAPEVSRSALQCAVEPFKGMC